MEHKKRVEVITEIMAHREKLCQAYEQRDTADKSISESLAIINALQFAIKPAVEAPPGPPGETDEEDSAAP